MLANRGTPVLLGLSFLLSLVKASPNTGTFQNPSVHVRPKFRYWIPDASVDPTVVASDVRAAGNVGAGGLELLGYYLYGGPPSNGAGRGDSAPVDWAEYGFGTQVWYDVFRNFAQSHKDEGLIMDFSLGPNQGTGVPAIEGSDGLSWDIVAFNISVPIGGTFSGILPAWGTGHLEAAVTGLATKSERVTGVQPGLPGDLSLSRTQVTLAESSLQDVTEQVGSDGSLSVTFPSNTTGLNYNIFAIYLIHSDFRAQDGPSDLGGPQTSPQSFLQNGSWAADHFSAAGARTTTSFWEQYILNNGTRELLMDVGNYGWEDSVEIEANVFWTQNLSSLFTADHGYSISKWLPILFHRNGHAKQSNPSTWWIIDAADSGNAVIADYRETLGTQYQAYLSGLNSWAKDYLNLRFSAQVSYNLPMDMLANIPYVDIPECESLDFSDLIDGYRQYAGPANFASKNIVSSECGAVRGEAYIQTLPELMWHVKRSYAGGVNQFVFHGLPYSGNYGNTTWPVFTTFNYQYSAMHGPHEPAWDYYSDHINFVARNNYIFQSGVPQIDIAFWQKVTVYPGHITARTYEPTDLEEAGYSYQYLSPDNFDLPSAVVQNGILAPDAEAFKALVVRANDSLTISSVSKLAEFAHSGLPIVFSGGIPANYLGLNSADAIASAKQTLNDIVQLDNVITTDSYDGLATTIASFGILPATEISTNGSIWNTFWRQDNTADSDYVFVYNDAINSNPGEGISSGSIEFQSTGVPYEYDAWTGEQTPILVYDQTENSTTIPFELAGNQSTIVAFRSSESSNATTSAGAPVPSQHLTSISDGILGVLPFVSQNNPTQSSITIKSGPGTTNHTLTTSTNRTISISPCPFPSFSFQNFTLTVEHWTPPSNLSSISIADPLSGLPTTSTVKFNTTHDLSSAGSSLPSWRNIPGLGDAVSERGYYHTTFIWPPPLSSNSSNSNNNTATSPSPTGMILHFPPIYHTLTARLNGHPLPPLDPTAPKADVPADWLRPAGEPNVLEAVVATPLGNVLRTVWTQLRSSGTNTVGLQPAPPVGEYGIVGEVVGVPYLAVGVEV